jgi:dephospho-CoA kinase
VITIGLTGGIGSGKSTAAAMLEERGAIRIDADKVGHEVYLPGTPCWHELVDQFGRSIVADDGTIDRKRLGAKVFADPEALAALNALVWPRIAELIDGRIRGLRAAGSRAPVVLEAAILIEARWQWLVDQIWVITVERERAIERVMASRKLERGDVERRIASQLSDAERTREAVCVIANDGTPDDLRAALSRCWSERVPPENDSREP